MNPYQTLLLLRLIELAVMLVVMKHIVQCPTTLMRQIVGWGLIFLNLAAIVVAVGWAKVTLW